MGKNRDKKSKKKDWVEDSTPLNNPFAALAGLSASKKGPEPEEIKEEDAPAVSSAPPARAVVRLEKKGRGGKKVTVVSHLGLSPGDMEAWCKELRSGMGCGGQVEGENLVLHGDQRKRVADLLEARGVKKVTRS